MKIGSVTSAKEKTSLNDTDALSAKVQNRKIRISYLFSAQDNSQLLKTHFRKILCLKESPNLGIFSSTNNTENLIVSGSPKIVIRLTESVNHTSVTVISLITVIVSHIAVIVSLIIVIVSHITETVIILAAVIVSHTTGTCPHVIETSSKICMNQTITQ